MLRGGLVGRAATKHEAIRSPPSGFGRQPRSCLRAAPGNHRRVPVGSPPPPQSLSRGKKWLFRSALVLLPIFACLTAEIGLRMGGYGFDPHFFKHATIGGTDFIVQNEDFTLRFFPKEMVATPVLCDSPPTRPLAPSASLFSANRQPWGTRQKASRPTVISGHC